MESFVSLYAVLQSVVPSILEPAFISGFSAIDTGFWSIVPPLLALILALITKEVYSSLAIGVFAGMIIFQFHLNGPGAGQLIDSFVMVPKLMAEQIMSNGALILFLALLGALVVVIAAAGGSKAYGEWVSKYIKSARMANFLTAVLGILIFVDDYFNCLTVGAVMRPVTDRFGISREKLAWLIDSMAAPVCIIAPISSWAVAIGGYLGENGFTTFVQAIPFNFYAIITIAFVFFMCFSGLDWGPMKTAEAQAKASLADKKRIPPRKSVLETVSTARVSEGSDIDKIPPEGNIPVTVTEKADLENAASHAMEDFKGIAVSEKGKVYDLVIPILVLIVAAILGMLYVGGFFQGVDFGTAVGEDSITGLNIGVSLALLIAAFMFLPRRLMNLGGFVEGMSEGVRSMVGAIMILVLAWSLGSECRDFLGTGEFVSGFVYGLGIDMAFFAPVLFVVAALIAFSMGTSWGTIALIMPIVIGLFAPDDPLFIVGVGATLGGAVYGDHVSPISDTTILSSAGAQCNHLRHVATQFPYATLVMMCCLVGYIVCAFTGNPWISLALSALLVVAFTLVLSKLNLGIFGMKKKA